MFFFNVKILIFQVFKGLKAQKKNGPKWQKVLSVAPYFSGTIYHMIFIYGTHVYKISYLQAFFSFLFFFTFDFLDHLAGEGRLVKFKKLPKITKKYVCLTPYLWNRTSYIVRHFFKHFLQLVNGSENSILNWVTMKLNLFVVVFFFFCFETPLKYFPFYFHILLTLCFRYLETHIKESFMYVSSQLFFNTPHKTLRFQETSKKNAFSPVCRSKFLKVYLQCLPWGHPTDPLN